MALKLTKESGALKLTKADGTGLQRVIVGLGWDPVRKGGGSGFFGKMFGGGGQNTSESIDLDASVLVFDRNKRCVETVYFGRLSGMNGAIRHSGDNRTGAGDGDDETITVDLAALSADVQSLVFVINSYSGQLFTQVANASCRIVDETTGVEHSKYELTNGAAVTGYLMAKVVRNANGWEISALGEPAGGRTVRDLEGVAARFI